MLTLPLPGRWLNFRRALSPWFGNTDVQHPTAQTVVHLNSTAPIHRVDRHYLSFSIDISVLAGGFWWEGAAGSRKGLGTIRVPPLNLNNKKLDALVAKLGPAYLRIGGSEADRIHYFFSPQNESDSLVLTETIWDNLQDFIARHQLLLSFTFKYGLFKRTLHGNWHASEIEQLLKHTRERGQRIDICELGNELNAYWAFHGFSSQPRAHNLAADYRVFSKAIREYLPEARIIGPGSAFWPKLGETIRPFSNITHRFLQQSKAHQTKLDIIDWHYYPFQSHRSPVRTRAAKVPRFLKPSALNDFARYSRQLKNWRDEYFPGAELWTGETGSAQCGGEPQLSDRFISCFWWADQLGQGGLHQQAVMIRQSLIGGEYGMVDRLTLKPRPDYWLSWLWQQLMGVDVYRVSSSHHMLRTYCHSDRQGDQKTLLLINLSAKPIRVNAQQIGRVQAQYCLTAKRLQSKKVRINDIKAKFNKGNFALDDFTRAEINYELPGHSISFWRIENRETLDARRKT